MPDTNAGIVMQMVRSPLFLASSAILIVGAAILQPAAGFIEDRTQPRPIPPAKPLQSFRAEALRGFFPIERDLSVPAKPAEIGTHEFYKRTFQPSGLPLPAEIFVTYYTGAAKTVPHTPDVCYRQNGFALESAEEITLDVAGPGGTTRTIPVWLLRLSRPRSDGGKLEVAVVYCFNVNGRFLTRRNAVRLELAKFWRPAFYFSKIEAMSVLDGPETRETAVESCTRLLAKVIPVLTSEHFPSSEQLARAQE
jgi:hypothetical protein